MAEAGPSSQNTTARPDPSKPPGIGQCGSAGCICCKHIWRGHDQFQSTTTKQRYKITQHLTCKTPSVVYIIECKKCPVQYVGKTSTTLQRRFGDYRASIKRCQHRPIADHFNQKSHTINDLIIYPIKQVCGYKALKKEQDHWIRELRTFDHGLNLESYKHDLETDKIKFCGEGDPSPKKRKKLQKKRQSVFSPETEERLSECEDALREGQQAASQVYDKLTEISSRGSPSSSFLALKNKISNLKGCNPTKTVYIGLFGKTGAGKSSLINALTNENQLLPSGGLYACTSVFVHVQANTETDKYKAHIEFISKEEWQSELHFLLEILSDSDDDESQKMRKKTADDDDMEKMAEEKIKAIYGIEGLRKSYSELVGCKQFPEVPKKCKKTLVFDTAKELSQNIGCYIRSDKKSEQQFWPLVKRVTIYLPNSPALLEGIVLVDLPGAGDANKHRDEMWKECLSLCSSVWIVNDINRVLSEKVANEIFDKTLRTIAGGGECHNITFVCTKTDIINPEEIKENYNFTDMDFQTESDDEDPQEYETLEKQACVRFRNDIAKDEINSIFKEKAKKLLLGDEGNSDDFFDVYTVSSQEFRRIEQGRSSFLDRDDTGIPSLMEQIKKLYVSHSVKEVKDYISEVSGTISYIHSSNDVHSARVNFSNTKEFNRLEKELLLTCTNLNISLNKVNTALHEHLWKGAKTAQKDCLENARKNALEPTWKDNRGHHRTLKALCRNYGFFRSSNGNTIDLNHALSEPMYKNMNDTFMTTFGSGGSRSSIKGQLASFQENFITDELLKSYRKEDKRYLRLVYIRTEQRKLRKHLEKYLIEKKKLIYNAISDSIRDTIKPTYQECTEIHGKCAFIGIQKKLKDQIELSKNDMFRKAMDEMLKEFSQLQKHLLHEIKTQMRTSLRVALHQIPDDLTDLPDVTEEIEMMQRCCDSLELQVF